MQLIESHDDKENYEILKKLFVPEKIPPYELFLREAAGGKFTIYRLDEDGYVGIVGVWALDDHAFLQFFAIDGECRSKGAGSRAMQAVKEKFPSLIIEAIFDEREEKKRLIAFYEKNGFIVNEYPYFQPSYRDGEKKVPLKLMSYPAPLKQEVVAEIHATVYKETYRGE